MIRKLVKELEEKHGWEVDEDFIDDNEGFLDALVKLATQKSLTK